MATTTRISTPARSDVLRDRVQGLARELGPGAKFPKVVELCREWQVSPTTLNRVMSGLEEEGWLRRQHAVGVFVSDDVPMSHLLSSVAIICRPSFFMGTGHSPFWDLLLETSQNQAARHGVSCDLYFSREPDEALTKPLPDALVLAFENRKIGAVLGIGLDDVTAMWLMERGVPVVNAFGKGHVIVGFDVAHFTRLAVSTLREMGLETPTLCLNMPAAHSSFAHHWRREWCELFARETRLAESQLSRHVLLGDAARFSSNSQQGVQFAHELFGKTDSPRPRALICVDDMTTHGLLVGLREMGVRVGHDVQIVSHSNADSPILLGESALIRLEYSPTEIVSTMWEQLEGLLLSAGEWPEDQHVNIAPHRA